MDEEDITPVEAMELAVKKRKYIIQKATMMLDDDPLEDKLPLPSFTEEEEEEDEKMEEGEDDEDYQKRKTTFRHSLMS